MKSFNIHQLIEFIDTKTPFLSISVRSLSFIDNSTYKFKVLFNDQTEYHIDMDEETYYLAQ